jgi:hypothetical protein
MSSWLSEHGSPGNPAPAPGPLQGGRYGRDDLRRANRSVAGDRPDPGRGNADRYQNSAVISPATLDRGTHGRFKTDGRKSPAAPSACPHIGVLELLGAFAKSTSVSPAVPVSSPRLRSAIPLTAGNEIDLVGIFMTAAGYVLAISIYHDLTPPTPIAVPASCRTRCP